MRGDREAQDGADGHRDEARSDAHVAVLSAKRSNDSAVPEPAAEETMRSTVGPTRRRSPASRVRPPPEVVDAAAIRPCAASMTWRRCLAGRPSGPGRPAWLGP